MPPKIIISYDDTDNDRDALALGRLLAFPGADLSLAYVRHTQEPQRDREKAEERKAEQLLEHGAKLIGAPDLPRHVVFHASTGAGLIELATREQADVVVFGSDYRTARGAVIPQKSAERLMTGGPVSVAIAPADFRSRSSARIARIGVLSDGDDAADETARALGAALDASVTEFDDEPVDLLVLGSRKGTPPRRVELSASAAYEIDKATYPVLAVASGKPIRFASPAPVATTA
jgi:nucleotide-binding universal stress UspA family protein